MKDKKKIKGLMKRAFAVTLGIAMAFGALMLPVNSTFTDSFITASADDETVVIDGNTYTYTMDRYNGELCACLKSVEFSEPVETYEVPSKLTRRGIEYPVNMIDTNFLKGDQTVKTIVFPDTVKSINYSVLAGSVIENITLPNDLEKLGANFASECDHIKSVKYEGTKIVGNSMGHHIFYKSDISNIINDKGAVCLGNWIVRYEPETKPTELKVADLGSGDIKVENIASYVFYYTTSIRTLDLEGIKYISNSNFDDARSINSIINDDCLEKIDGNQLSKSEWYEEGAKNGFVKLGPTLLYYGTDSKVIDLTTERCKGLKEVNEGALSDCKNADTLFIHSDTDLDYGCFYEAYKQNYQKGEDLNDNLPKTPSYNIKYIYLDGKPLAFSEKTPKLDQWIQRNRFNFKGTAWLRTNAEAKIKAVFEQMDLDYYGFFNDKVGTLSKTEEFYAFLKVHDYISLYQAGGSNDISPAPCAMLTAGKANCSIYSDMTAMLLECAGVDHMSLTSDTSTHGWDEVRIGDEWFECDAGWDEQIGHTYGWFALSSSNVYERDNKHHKYGKTNKNWHTYTETDRILAKRTIGDINGNNKRDENDALLLWTYLKGGSDTIDEKAADINFDGVIDVTDGVLLQNFVTGTALDVENVPTDGMAPGFKVAFFDGKDYDNIQYAYTDRDGYIVLPADTFEAPEGKKLSYDIGKVGQRVKIHNPYQVIQAKWIDENEPDYSEPESSSKPDSSKPESSSSNDSSKTDDTFKLGDVNGDRTIDIEDAVAIIQHINGLTPLTDDQEKRADVSKDGNIDIDDAVLLISYVNGNSTF